LPDALSLKFENVKPTKHDDAPPLFEKIVRNGKIGRENLRFVRLLEKVVSDKSGADYGKKTFSYEDAKRYVESAGEFASAVRSLFR